MIVTSAFALALLAFASAVAALIICAILKRGTASLESRMEKRWQQHDEKQARSNERVSDKLHELQLSTPARLAAEVAALADGLDKLTAQHRKLHGFVHATKPRDPHPANGAVDDDELQAMLAFQQAPPVDPNKRN